MSIAFDFSVEELWVPLVAGATIVPNAGAATLFDGDLAEFLERRQVTCLCCVPTLLASLDRDLPKLRILLIGGEACPPALVKRWSRPGRVLLNSYGPTETTVTATLADRTLGSVPPKSRDSPLFADRARLRPNLQGLRRV
jgi:non-ribosomal peptide synthetase component F